MNPPRPRRGSSYHSPLRAAQAQDTRNRIGAAVFAVFQGRGGQEEITFKDVAKAAGVTEMTVYRHFPRKEDLLRALWERINARLGVGMPGSAAELLNRNQDLHLGFEKEAPLILASITTPQGRDMRLSQKNRRQAAFLKVAGDVNPRFSPKEKRRVAAVLQLLQSSYAWDSMRSNWDMGPKEIAAATRLAMEAVIAVTGAKEKP